MSENPFQRPWELRLSEIVGERPMILDAEEVAASHEAQRLLESAAAKVGHVPLPTGPDRRHGHYALYTGDQDHGLVPGFVVVSRLDTGERVGGMVDGTIWLDAEHRRQGLGREIVLAGMCKAGGRALHPDAYFSVPGYRAHVAAHRKAIEDALANDVSVPKAVLNDHPELAVATPTP